MHDGARVRFHGASTGFDDETTVTTHYEQTIHAAKNAAVDDGKTCVVRAVFAPRMPDPTGYAIDFPEARSPVGAASTGPMNGMTPFGRANEPPGYGTLNVSVQRCRNPAASPDENCP
jgi:hypothetical protein